MPSPHTWLDALHVHCRRPVLMMIIIGSASGICVIAQAALLAHLLHQAVIDHAERTSLTALFAALAAIICLRALLVWGREACGQRSSTLVRRFVRRDLLERLNAAGPVTIHAKQSAALTSSVIERVEGLHGYFAYYLPQKSLAVIVPTMIIITAFSVSWAIGLIFLITAPLIPLLMIMIGRGAETLSQKNFQQLARMSAHFLDTLQGLTTLKLFMRSEDETARIAASSEEYRKGTMAVLRIAFLSSAVLELLTSVAIAMSAVFLGLSYLHFLDFGLYGQPLTLRAGLFLLLLAPDVYLPLRELGTHFHARAEALGAAAELSSLLTKRQNQRRHTGAEKRIKEQAITIEMSHVSHRFADRDQPALDDLCLTVPAGRWLAIVGASGAGKSTLLNLLLGFLPLQQGEIRINGHSLADLELDQWRQHIAWVPQQPQLFFGSLADNIALHNPALSTKQIAAAAEQACLSDLVGCVPNGLISPVGERGSRLSGGQIRRVALARAFAKNAALLLLDEPTAGLDQENERLIMSSLTQLAQNKTVIMLTHRLDTARQADRIAVMANGTIVEEGHHDQLLARNGFYARLVAGGCTVMS